MRLVALVLVLCAACGARGDRDPAWPKMAERETDGGESLAPRAVSVAIESTKDKPDDAAKPADAAKPDEATPAAKPDEAKPTETPIATPATDDVIIIDDIVIEIED